MMWEVWLIAWWVLFLALAWWPCCCGAPAPVCGVCLPGTTPSTLQITLSGITVGSYNCDCGAVNGTYMVPHHPTKNCYWHETYYWACDPEDPGDPIYGDDYVEITSFIALVESAHEWITRVTITRPDCAAHSTTWKYRTPDMDDFDCSATYNPPLTRQGHITDLCITDDATCQIN